MSNKRIATTSVYTAVAPRAAITKIRVAGATKQEQHALLFYAHEVSRQHIEGVNQYVMGELAVDSANILFSGEM